MGSGFVTALGSGGGVALYGTVALTRTEVTGNTAEGTAGGVLLARGPTALLDQVTIEGNASVRGNGGGVVASGGFATIEVLAHRSVIRGNQTPRNGGGVSLSGAQQSGGVIWRGAAIDENVASSGAGVYFDGGRHELRDVTLTGNEAGQYGGGAGGGWYGPWFTNWSVVVDGCRFEGNVAHTQTGGGIDLGQRATITSTEFVGNVARKGAAVSLVGWRTFSATPLRYTLTGVELVGNEATESGGGLFVDWNAAVDGTGLEIEGNLAPTGGGVFLADGSVSSTSGELGGNVVDDVWVAKVATAYTGLGEAFTCTNAGCSALAEDADARLAAESAAPVEEPPVAEDGAEECFLFDYEYDGPEAC